MAAPLWLFALKSPGIRISSLAIWRFIIPVSGAALSWMILPDDSPDPFLIVGAVLIAASIIVTFSEKEKPQ